jgi:hypothetical protein
VITDFVKTCVSILGLVNRDVHAQTELPYFLVGIVRAHVKPVTKKLTLPAWVSFFNRVHSNLILTLTNVPEINPCQVENGGCESFCQYISPGKSKCVCLDSNSVLNSDRITCSCNTGYQKIGTSCSGIKSFHFLNFKLSTRV